MDVALTDEEKAARIANIDDQLAKLDTSTPEGSARYNELMTTRNNYADNRQAQFELLQKTNPMTDDYHTGIRSPEEIYTLKNIVDTYNSDNNFTYPDFTLADAQKALANGNIDVYGSKPIEPGAFISPSKMMATDYAGGGEVYTKNIPLEDFAFIESGDEGNYLPVGKAKTVADLMAESKPKTYYHGSPETDITEFDINRAGKNTRSGEKAIYFTDTPEAAEEFAYERIPTDSNFIDKAGKRGGVYEANLDMRNTLDLDNLTDEQIKELWPYASYMGSWQGEDVFARDIKHWRDVKNPQLIKGYLDLEKLANSPYDSFSATMYPNTGNKAKEYAIFDASKAKITKSPKTVADLMNEPKPKTIYHGTNAVFEDFDESLPSVWFTDNADDIANTGLSNKGGKINIMERELPNNLKLADWDLADRLTKQQLIDRGYDGIAYTESGTSGKDTYYEIFKPNKTLKKIGKAR
jgi:hypothetical protein